MDIHSESVLRLFRGTTFMIVLLKTLCPFFSNSVGSFDSTEWSMVHKLRLYCLFSLDEGQLFSLLSACSYFANTNKFSTHDITVFFVTKKERKNKKTII